MNEQEQPQLHTQSEHMAEQQTKPFIPEFLKWTLPFLNLDLYYDANRGFSLKSKTEWQTVWILMRRLMMSRLISIYTVCTGIGSVCLDERIKP